MVLVGFHKPFPVFIKRFRVWILAIGIYAEKVTLHEHLRQITVSGIEKIAYLKADLAEHKALFDADSRFDIETYQPVDAISLPDDNWAGTWKMKEE
jgi:hypothetical protein